MNRHIAVILVSVILLGMILVTLNHWAMGPIAQTAQSSSADYSQLANRTTPSKHMSEAVRRPVSQVEQPPLPLAPATVVTQPDLPTEEEKATSIEETSVPQQMPATTQTPPETESTPKAATPRKTEHTSQEKQSKKIDPTPVLHKKTATQKNISQNKAVETPASTSPSPIPDSAPAKMTFSVKEKSVTLQIHTVTSIDIKAFSLQKPARLVIDLHKQSIIPSLPNIPENSLIRSIRAGRHKDMIRIVLDLKTEKPTPFTAKQLTANVFAVQVNK